MVLGLSNDIKVKLGEEKDCLEDFRSHAGLQGSGEDRRRIKNVQSRVKIAGFRPGKAPIELIRHLSKALRKRSDLLSAKASTKRCRQKISIRPIAVSLIQSRQSLRVRI